VSQLAYVGDDWVIYAVRPDGAGKQAITSQGTLCTWPTWSPDGSSIAFSGFRSGYNGHNLMGVYLKNPGDGPPRLLYSNEPGTDAIAQRTPHYLIWSPDSRRLAIIAQTYRGGLTLFVRDIAGSDQPRRVVDGGPLYMSWSHDSRFLLVHSHRVHHVVDCARGMEAQQVPGSSSLYMAPSWCPTANRMALCRDIGGDRQSLFVLDIAAGNVTPLAELGGIGAFAWRPDGSSIGLVRDLDGQSGFYPGLWLLEASGHSQQRIIEDPILCFFWSPDGRQVACITPSEFAPGLVRWAVLNVAAGSTRYLPDFRPTQEQLTAFTFFDQYAQSHSPWSPDGRYLVFSGALGHQREQGSLSRPEAAGVFVADIESNSAPERVASGVFGSWGRT
jgi:TolB protein